MKLKNVEWRFNIFFSYLQRVLFFLVIEERIYRKFVMVMETFCFAKRLHKNRKKSYHICKPIMKSEVCYD